MAFNRLQLLGEVKFRKILNALMRGESAMGLARTIQSEWGHFTDIPEKTLTQQLNRLRLTAAEGAFGEAVAEQIKNGATPQIKMLKDVNLSVMQRMEELAEIQRSRVIALVKKEKDGPDPSQHHASILKVIHVGKTDAALLQATNAVFTDYSKLLQDLQKMRFDLGMDEYHGPVNTFRGAMSATTLPDGTTVQRQVFEATSAIEGIFEKRKIPFVDVAG